ncbi:hypothetical protein [Arsenophonus sp. ENCA]|nr:hypothetical protein [Arsenophonus sp. ENCA]
MFFVGRCWAKGEGINPIVLDAFWGEFSVFGGSRLEEENGDCVNL